MIYCAFDIDPIQIRYALKDLLKDYNLTHLIQVHRSFVVNLEKISSYYLSMNRINIKDQNVPVSRAYKDQLLDKLKK